MNHHHCNPQPYPPPTTQNQLPSDGSESSDFPPIRIRNSTPNPPNTKPVISRYRSSHKLALGHRNIVNTVEVTAQRADVSHHASSQTVLLVLINVPEWPQVLV